jgi:glycosyltransferase involved in cell wall biosynthesis
MKRILFFHQGRIADWAGAVHRGLSGQFPSTEIINFDLHHLIKARPCLIVKNLVAAVGRYGGDLLLGKRDLDDAFFTTPYVFREIRKISHEIHEKYPSDFSFQVHSMHDHSSPDRPHFVYTDYSYENCRENAAYKRHRWAPSRADWLIEMERAIYNRASCTFVQSELVAHTIRGKYRIPAEQVLNVRYGPNVDIRQLIDIPAALDRFRRKTVIFVGGDWERKGGPELVESFKLVLQSHPQAKLLIAGCKPGLNLPYTEELGKVPLDELAAYYAQASVFCMPSRLEPSASVYVEAMCAGLPVVALNAGAVRELVVPGETGYLAEPGDVEGLSKSIIRLFDDPELCRRLAENGRTSVLSQYAWPSVFQKVGAKIRSALSVPL